MTTALLHSLADRLFRGANTTLPDTYEYLRGLSTEVIGAVVRDRWAISSNLCALRKRFDTWLWIACNETLDRQVHDNERENALNNAVTQLVPLYPSRPEHLLPPSSSVDSLRAVLTRATEARENSPDCGRVPEGIDATLDSMGQIYHCAWTDAYLTELLEALISVIEKHGVHGWKCVRWEVYDKVCHSISLIMVRCILISNV